MDSDSAPPPPLPNPLDENINRGLVCGQMHSLARTPKILTFMSEAGECRQQEHTQHAPSTKTECDYLNVWIEKEKKKPVTYAKFLSKIVNPDIKLGTKKKEYIYNRQTFLTGSEPTTSCMILRPWGTGSTLPPSVLEALSYKKNQQQQKTKTK